MVNSEPHVPIDENRFREVLSEVRKALRRSGLLAFADSLTLVSSVPIEVPNGTNGKRRKLKPAFRIFLARIASDTKPYFILDATDTLSENTSGVLYLRKWDQIEASKWLTEHLRPDDWIDANHALVSINRRLKGEAEVLDYLSSHLYTPASSLRDIQFIHEPGFWERFVAGLVEFHAKKDPAITLAFKATILEGVDMSSAPHAIIVTNSFTGKTVPFTFAGKVLDRVTAKSLIGAYRQDGLSSGSLSNYRRVIVIEQIEAQDAPMLLAFLFNIMETGEGLQEIGGHRSYVHTNATIVITGNPLLGTDSSSEAQSNAFHSILQHLSLNVALGRRFGIILFGNEYKEVEKTELDLENPAEKDDYAVYWEILREVERACREKIEKVFANPEVVQWLNELDDSYSEQVSRLAVGLGPRLPLLFGFLISHGSNGQKHMRGAALRCAILDALPSIENGTYDAGVLLKLADEYLQRFSVHNLESVARLAVAGQQYGSEMRSVVFPRLPNDLQLVVKAAMEFRRSNPGVKSIPLQDLEAWRPNKEESVYWSTIVNHLLELSLEKYADILDRYFGMRIDRLARTLYFTD